MSDKAPKPDVPTPLARFEFVTDHDSQHQIRQHVAKLNWKRRKARKALPQRPGSTDPRPITSIPVAKGPHCHPHQRPERGPARGDLSQHQEEDKTLESVDVEDETQPLKSNDIASNGLYVDLKHTLILISPSRKWKLSTIPTQMDSLLSLYHPLNSMDLDPFNSTMALSRADQRLLHHWANEYAIKAFGHPTDPAFSPLGNVHVPIDFSHRASVHGILAHSASHIACLRGEKTSVEALKHKMTAIHLVNQALMNDETAVSDENISAVWMLLTYERYWGTEEVWHFHRRGLNQMIKRRGGLSTLSDNWQLETRMHLVALMQLPRWKSSIFSTPSLPPDTLEYISNSSEQPHSDFTNFFSDIYSVTSDIAQAYPAIDRATQFLHSLAPSSEGMAASVPVESEEIARLMCFFYIATIVKGANRSHFNLRWLNDSLASTEQIWNNSVEILKWLLQQGVGRGRGGLEDVQRTEKLKEIAFLLNKSSYKSIEDRLLNVLVDGPTEDPFLPAE